MTAPDTLRPSRLPGPPIRVSFEFFPPKSAEAEAALWSSVERLAPLCPDFVSVTYGAGGSTRERTHATVARIVRETPLRPAAHLTCVGATKTEIDDVLRGYWAAGVRHVVALRGDPQGGVGARYEPHPGGYDSSADLVRGIKAVGDFEVSVSGYPEKHPESVSFDSDLDGLKAKIDAGATRAITQFFFDNSLYLRYVDRVRAAGIDIPIVPGVVCIQNFPDLELRPQDRRDGAGLARRPLRGTGERPRHTSTGGGRHRGRTGARPRRPRDTRFPLLHDEPRRTGLRHLPAARLEVGGRTGGGVTGGTRICAGLQLRRFARD